MAKHVEKVPSLEDFKAPWETDAGETEIDKVRLRKYIHSLTLDKARAQDARDEATEQVETVSKERDEAKAAAEKGGDPDLAKELEAERAKTAKETDRANKAERSLVVTQVAASKGLTETQAKRLQGSTKEELEADADELLTSFGGAGNGDNESEGEGLTRTPRSLVTPNTGKGTKSNTPTADDIEKVVAGFETRVF